ncbi:trigger factor [Dehalococcoidia bacterium]|nr:trigger factor [Dehalococcoidia bacterium]
MKITQEEVVNRQTVLLIEMDDEDLDPYLDRGYRKIVQRVNMPGFRKGKAPRSIIERYLGRESLLQESIEYMLPDISQRAVEAQELETSGMPRLELEGLDPVKVKVTVPLVPEVDLGDYKTIRVEETVVNITDSDVDKRLEDMRTEASTWVPVNRTVKMGDMVTMSVTGIVGDQTIINQPDAIHSVEEGSVVPIPGFSEKLAGAKPGEPKTFTLAITDDHPDKSVAGKEAQFDVTVSEIKERELPELDDDFAKGFREGYDSLKAMRQEIESSLKSEAETAQQTQYREATIDALLAKATVEIPPLLTEHEIEHMVERRNQFVASLKMELSDYLKITGKTDEETLEEIRENATDRLRRSWAISKLAEVESLEVSQTEIDERIQSLANSSEDPSKFLENPNLKSEEVSESLRQSILMEKAVNQLGELAKKQESDGTKKNKRTVKKKPNPKKPKTRKSKGGDDADAGT